MIPILISTLLHLLTTLKYGDNMAKRTTIKKLQKNMCYCLKREEDISLDLCQIGDCHRFKSCLNKTNNDIDKEMEKKHGKAA